VEKLDFSHSAGGDTHVSSHCVKSECFILNWTCNYCTPGCLLQKNEYLHPHKNLYTADVHCSSICDRQKVEAIHITSHGYMVEYCSMIKEGTVGTLMTWKVSRDLCWDNPSRSHAIRYYLYDTCEVKNYRSGDRIGLPLVRDRVGEMGVVMVQRQHRGIPGTENCSVYQYWNPGCNIALELWKMSPLRKTK
jgi:hypothetical protein